MDLNRVAIFVRVAEEESFTGAATALGLPKSSVSRSVARLEEELGVRLVQRTTRKLSLTDAGRLYFDRARAAMGSIEDASAAVADMGKEPRGTVRLTAPVDMANALLATVVAEFVKKHPLIRIELHLSARVVNLVEEGFDLAVRAGKLDDSSLVARRIGVPEIALFATPAYLKKRGRPKTAEDLAHHDFVIFRSREPRNQLRLTGPQGEQTIHIQGPVEADDLSFVYRLVRADVGIGGLPVTVGSEAGAPALQRVLPDHSMASAPLHVVAPSRQYEPVRVQLFREYLVKSLSQFKWALE